MKSRDELRMYKDLVREWFVRTYGHLHLRRAQAKRLLWRLRSRPSKAARRLADESVAALKAENLGRVEGRALRSLRNDEMETVVHSNLLNVKVSFERAIYLTKPDVSSMVPFFASGMISSRQWASMNSDAHGVEMQETSPEKFIAGLMLAEGQMPPEEQMRLELEQEQRSLQLQLQAQKKMLEITPPPPAPASGGSGGGTSRPAARPKIPNVSMSLSSVTGGLSRAFAPGGRIFGKRRTSKRKNPKPAKRRRIVGMRKKTKSRAAKARKRLTRKV